MSNARSYKALAADLGISERQFHRRLDAGDKEAREALRSELCYVHGATLTNATNELHEVAEIIQRADPELAKILDHVAGRLSKFHDAPVSKFRQEHEARLDALLNLKELPDEEYQAFADDLSKLPPTPEEYLKRTQELLEGLDVEVDGGQ